MDALLHTKKQLHSSTGSGDEADSMFGITLGMPRHASWHSFKITKYFFCFYGCLITYNNSPSQLNLFVRCDGLKDPAI